jgi:tripartite-type tricarboxylate transporter receptor subunit TctC
MYGGVLDVAWANPATAKASLDGGKIKILGITGSRRVSVLPQVTTFTEQGFDGFALDSWLGFMGPARMPRPVVDKLAGALREITQSPEVRERLQALGFEPLGNTPEEFAVAQKAELPQWAALVKAAGVSIN